MELFTFTEWDHTGIAGRYFYLYGQVNFYFKERLEEVYNLDAYRHYRVQLTAAIRTITNRCHSIYSSSDVMKNLGGEDLDRLTDLFEQAFTRLREFESDQEEIKLNLLNFCEIVEFHLANLYSQVYYRATNLSDGSFKKKLRPAHRTIPILAILKAQILGTV